MPALRTLQTNINEDQTKRNTSQRPREKWRNFLVLVSFLAQLKPKILFHVLFLLRNQTETLVTQAIFLLMAQLPEVLTLYWNKMNENHTGWRKRSYNLPWDRQRLPINSQRRFYFLHRVIYCPFPKHANSKVQKPPSQFFAAVNHNWPLQKKP